MSRIVEIEIKTRVAWREVRNYTLGTTTLYLCLGKLRIASVRWDPCVGKGDSKNYRATQLLPQDLRIGNFETEHEAQQACHFVLNEMIDSLSDPSALDRQKKGGK